ncbi:MAG: FIST C-terminal domain-containing protein [Bacteroidales bacterium]|nr:FIST C-terminal domain-containing protein [Bacteroidales bacterium]
MRSEQLVYRENIGWQQLNTCADCSNAGLVFVFGSRDLLSVAENIEYITKRYPAAEIVGCSTSGEIFREEVLSSTIVCTAVQFEKTIVRVVEEHIGQAEESYSIGQKLAANLDTKGLVHIMVLSEGLNINGSELTKGLNSVLGGRIQITGGLAGDSEDFIETVLVHNRVCSKNLVIAIGFYGDNIKIGYGSMGGWDSFGVDRLVTRSMANVLYELDGQPALELYKKYLGHHAAGLPASALLFPLSLRSADSDVILVRTILSVSEKDGSMTFAGDIPEGDYVRLMKASFEKLVGGAFTAAELSGTSLGDTDPDLAILISCVGRRLVLKQRVEEEVEAVREVLGSRVTITGFYSYGEICPGHPFGQRCELHNQTMTITLFKEQ